MKSRLPSHDKREKELSEAIAVLIASTRNKKRPFPLTEIARKLELAVAILGSHKVVAERIGLSPKMLKQFSTVTQLSKAVQGLFERRVIDSVDAAAHLTKVSKSDQKVIAEAFAAGSIDTSDIRAIVELAVKKDGPISEILERVQHSKTQKEYIAEFVVRGARTEHSLLKAFQRQIPHDEIHRVEVHGALGRLVLTRKGKMALEKIAKESGAPISHAIQTIISSSKSV